MANTPDELFVVLRTMIEREARAEIWEDIQEIQRASQNKGEFADRVIALMELEMVCG